MGTYNRTNWVNLLSDETFALGLRDQSGREIGYRITVMAMELEADAEGYGAYTLAEAFEVRAQPLRDGAKFGASQRHKYAPTAAGAMGLGLKQMRGAALRYAKKFAAANA